MEFKKSIWIVGIAAALSIGIWGCSPQQAERAVVEPEQEAAEPFFVPNPIVIPKQEVKTLEIGATAPHFNLPGVDGRWHSLEDYDEFDVLALVFTATHCPAAQQFEQEYNKIVEDYKGQSVALVAISSSSPLGVKTWELGWSDLGDDFEGMIIRAKEGNFQYPYLYDGDTQEVSLKYGPVATPHCFVFDSERILRYAGRAGKKVSGERELVKGAGDLRGAIDALLAGEEIEEPVTPTFGCSTKWSWKAGDRNQKFTAWMDNPVELEEIDLDGVGKLLENDTHRILMVNVWATWCAPCLEEYPELMETYAMYHPREYFDPDRGFDFASISTDDLENKDKALRFLESFESKTLNNHIYNGDDVYDLIEKVDPEWNGALPYTLLVAPGGEVYYRHQGAVDVLELRRAIVDHPALGRIQ